MTSHPGAGALAAASARDDHGSSLVIERQLERRLPSGRSLVLRTEAAGEELEIRSGRGEVELKIMLTDAGPVVTLGGGRLVVDSTDVVFRCQTFAVQAAAEVSLTSQSDVRIQAKELHAQTEQDIHLNGAYIRLNCTPDAPLQVPPMPPQLPTSVAAEPHVCDAAAEPGPHAHSPAAKPATS